VHHRETPLVCLVC